MDLMMIGLSFAIALAAAVWVVIRRGNKAVEELKEENLSLLGRLRDERLARERVEQLLRIQQDALPRTERIPVYMLCRELVGNCQKKTRLEVRLVSRLPMDFAIRSNYSCLRKVLECLLDNAVRSTKTGEVILVVTDDGRRGYLAFAVAGTDPDSAAVSTPVPPVCRTLVTLLGGEIWADRDYKKGLRIVFDIKGISI